MLRPGAHGRSKVTGPVIQYGLPDRLLFDRIENLVFADPPPTRLGHECLTSACRQLRPPAVHRLGRDAHFIPEAGSEAGSKGRTVIDGLLGRQGDRLPVETPPGSPQG